MGEMADLVLNGAMCQECGELFIDGAIGFPRTCDACKPRSAKRPPHPRIGGQTKPGGQRNPRRGRGAKTKPTWQP